MFRGREVVLDCTAFRMKKFHRERFAKLEMERRSASIHLTFLSVCVFQCLSFLLILLLMLLVLFSFSMQHFRYSQVPRFLSYSSLLREIGIANKAPKTISSRTERLKKSSPHMREWWSRKTNSSLRATPNRGARQQLHGRGWNPFSCRTLFIVKFSIFTFIADASRFRFLHRSRLFVISSAHWSRWPAMNDSRVRSIFLKQISSSIDAGKGGGGGDIRQNADHIKILP